MKLNLINFTEVLKDCEEVTSPEIMYRIKYFHKDGLFSEQIFGPVNDYQCQCGRHRGKEYDGLICERCGVRVGSSDLRRTTFAKITVPDDIVVVNPMILDILDAVPLKGYIDFKLGKLISGSIYIKKDPDDEGFIVGDRSDESFSSGPEIFKNQVYPYLMEVSEEFRSFDAEYRDYVFLKYIPVIPPDTRPIMQSQNDERQFFSDEINEKYEKILRQLNDIKKAPFLFNSVYITFQYKVNLLFKTIVSKFEKKRGFLRSHVLGKRIDYSGRAVISVDCVNLPLGYCKVPYEIASEIFKPRMLKLVSEELNISPLKVLKDYYKPYLKETIFKKLKETIIGTYVFLNRQPTLHRLSFQSCKVFDVILDDVIVIHPLITDSYNAD